MSRELDTRPAFDLFAGFMTTSVLAGLEMSGLLPQLETDSLDLNHPPSIDSVPHALLEAALDYLLQRGVVERKAGRFTLTAFGREVCNDKGYLVWLNGGYGEPLRHLDALLLGESEYGARHVRDGRWVANGSAQLGGRDVVPEATELLEEISFQQVLDLGCGNARFLMSLCERFGCDGVGVDISPAACEQAKRALTASGLRRQVQIVLGDAVDLAPISVEQTQLVVAFFLLHEIFSISRATLVEFLRDMSARLPSGAHLLAAEVEPPGRRAGGEERFTPEFTLVHSMMRQTLIDERAWREVLAEGGFDVERVVRPRMPGGLLLLARSRGD